MATKIVLGLHSNKNNILPECDYGSREDIKPQTDNCYDRKNLIFGIELPSSASSNKKKSKSTEKNSQAGQKSLKEKIEISSQKRNFYLKHLRESATEFCKAIEKLTE